MFLSAVIFTSPLKRVLPPLLPEIKPLEELPALELLLEEELEPELDPVSGTQVLPRFPFTHEIPDFLNNLYSPLPVSLQIRLESEHVGVVDQPPPDHPELLLDHPEPPLVV